MPKSPGLQPRRHLPALFFTAALAPAIALGWLGWRLIEQDRDLERQRIQERLEHAADLIGAQLKQALSEIEEQLAVLAALPPSQLNLRTGQFAGNLGENTIVAVFQAGELSVFPPDHLLYYPYLPPAREPPGSVFAAAEFLEYRERNYGSAIAAFRRLARSEEPEIRAGALLRLGRNLRKAGRTEDALKVYEELGQLGSTPVAELPAELVARKARCAVLAELGQTGALQREAAELYSSLSSGRWRITRAAYRFHTAEALRWLGSNPEGGLAAASGRRDALALASAVDLMWEEWQRIRRGDSQTSGRRSHWAYERPALVLWRGTPERVVALAAAAGDFGSPGLAALQGLVNRQDVNLAVTDVQGHSILGRFPGSGVQQAMRTAVDTQLPWTLHVASADPQGDQDALARRRRLLLSGLAIMAALVLAGGYFIARSFSREMAVARLQSDFVAAVSHEFRTPLTTMRQLTEMLARGRIPSEERRQRYYEVLAHETGRLHRLVEGLLNFGRMEAGALEFRFEPIDATTLVRNVVADFQKEAESRGYRIEIQACEEGVIIRADREAIERTLWNLLDNAVKYSPDCKTVWVDVAREGANLLVLVRDHGVGMPAEELKEIFKKFVRGEAARSTSVKGTGIGLTMVDRIVKAHGGRVRVDSEPGRGSTFTVVLPVEGKQ